MQRIYFPELDSTLQNIIISDTQIIHQLSKVLRIRTWDEITLFNWKVNKDMIFEITEITKKEITLQKNNEQENSSEINFELTLYNALPNKLEKIEYIIQKGTEIWYTKFYFFRSERSQKLIISDNKKLRLEKIITEAAEQSGRAIIPEIIIDESFDINIIPDGKNIFFHTQDEKSQSIKSITKNTWENINLFVGPEGGWSEIEVGILEKTTTRVHLGNRILRTETTGIVTGFYIIQS